MRGISTSIVVIIIVVVFNILIIVIFIIVAINYGCLKVNTSINAKNIFKSKQNLSFQTSHISKLVYYRLGLLFL